MPGSTPLFRLALTQPAFTVSDQHVVYTGTLQMTTLRQAHCTLHGLTRHQHRWRFQAQQQRTGLILHSRAYASRVEALTAEGLERYVVRSLRRLKRTDVTHSEVVALLARAGQVIGLPDVDQILTSPAAPRFGQYRADRWTLLPWERLQVPYAPSGPGHYVTLATAFWAAHAYQPSAAEEPSAEVRRALATGPVAPASLTLGFLIADPHGPFELGSVGQRTRYRIHAAALPSGHVGNIWLDGSRQEIQVMGGRVFGWERGSVRHDYTDRVDEVMVRALATFRDPAFQPFRGRLGQRLSQQLREHRLSFKVNGC